MAKLKILYIDDWGEWGGAEKVTLSLVKSLDRTKFEPYFILGCEGRFAQALRDIQIPVHIVPMTPMSIPASKKHLTFLFLPVFFARLVGYTFKSYIIIRRIQPDIIQTCSIQAKLIGSFVSKFLPARLLWHVQNIQPAGFRRKLVRLMARFFPDKIVATSNAVARLYADVVPPERLVVNHAGLHASEFDGIDSAQAQTALKAGLGLSGDTKIIVNASMIRFWKGQHILVGAAKEVLKDFPDTVFLIIGEAQFDKDKRYKQQLLDQIAELNLTHKIRFLGFREDVHTLVSAADCLVHCPIMADPLPTIVLEAMAVGTPVIGTDIGGISEQIDHQLTGLLVEPGNEVELSQAIITILRDADASKQFARAARQKLETEFSHKVFVERFEDIYTEIFTRR